MTRHLATHAVLDLLFEFVCGEGVVVDDLHTCFPKELPKVAILPAFLEHKNMEVQIGRPIFVLQNFYFYVYIWVYLHLHFHFYLYLYFYFCFYFHFYFYF